MGKKTFNRLLMMAAAVLLCACKSPQSSEELSQESVQESVQGSSEESVQDIIQESFTVGGITVSASEGLYQTLTDTGLTDAVEGLLAEKYGEEFICEQYLYHEEYSLMMDLTAYPAADPGLRFAVDVQGSDRLEIRWDKYYNELYRGDIDRYLYEAAAPYGIGQDEFFAKINGMVTTAEVSEETFYQQRVNIMISVSEQRAEEIQNSIQGIIEDIYDRMQSETGFWIYVCTDGIQGWEDFQYDSVRESYRVEYVEKPAGDPYGEEPAGGSYEDGEAHLEVYLGSVPGLYCEIPVQSGETAAVSLGDYPALIVVDGIQYKDTGRISTELRCGMLDGEITSTVDTVPAEDDQSNFGTGYGYQYGRTGIEVSIDGEWHIFEPYTDGE